MKITQLVSTACLLSALGTLACNNDTPTGSLTVSFKLGTNNVCSFKNAAGTDNPVADVRIALFRPGTVGSADPIAEETVACADGEALFTTINAGTYEIVAEGMDAKKLVVFDNEGEGDKAEVLEGQDNESNTVTLSLTPVKVYLRWSFGFGSSQCATLPLKLFDVEARRDDGNAKLGSGSFTCDASTDDPNNYHLLADMGRVLNGNDIDTIVITPTNATGKDVGDAASFSFDPPGPGNSVFLSIEAKCSGETCDLSGSGTPDAPPA